MLSCLFFFIIKSTNRILLLSWRFLYFIFIHRFKLKVLIPLKWTWPFRDKYMLVSARLEWTYLVASRTEICTITLYIENTHKFQFTNNYHLWKLNTSHSRALTSFPGKYVFAQPTHLQNKNNRWSHIRTKLWPSPGVNAELYRDVCRRHDTTDVTLVRKYVNIGTFIWRE